MKLEDSVIYLDTVNRRILAIVRCVHRDGTYTVESRFVLNDKGEREGPYLGYKYRMEGADLSPAAGDLV